MEEKKIYRNRLGLRMVQPDCWVWKFLTPLDLFWVLVLIGLFAIVGLVFHNLNNSMLGASCSSGLLILCLELIVRLPCSEDKDYPDLYESKKAKKVKVS